MGGRVGVSFVCGTKMKEGRKILQCLEVLGLEVM